MTRTNRRRTAEAFFGPAIKVLIAASAVFATALLVPAPASAAGQPWAVTAYSGSTPIAKAYGDFANNGGAYATVGVNYVDMSNNGRAVYVEVVWYNKIGVAWVQVAKKQTARTQRMRYTSTNLSNPLSPQVNSVRAGIKVCEDRNSALDKCSDTAYVSFSY